MLSLFYLWHTAHNKINAPITCRIVVICFHYFIFDILHTTQAINEPSDGQLWFAFIILSLTYCTQRLIISLLTLRVVICFHYFIFDILHTTEWNWSKGEWVLWFAFIILSLTYCTQLGGENRCFSYGCDLLSLFYLWHTAHNWTFPIYERLTVVICFHYFIFDILHTTTLKKRNTMCLLWFAFIILSLTYCTQLIV